mgnify:CR=1 FL=1
MVQVTRFAKDIITIKRYDKNYTESIIYSNIKADVQLRAYNIKDFSSESIEIEPTEKYYILVDKNKTNIRAWDEIIWTSPMWENKILLITSVSLERFLSRTNLIEIRAKDYAKQ